MAELASRHPAGVDLPVKPMAAVWSKPVAASRAVGALSMMDSEVMGPER